MEVSENQARIIIPKLYFFAFLLVNTCLSHTACVNALLAHFRKWKEMLVVNLITAIIGFRIVIPYCVNESTSHLQRN
jgi:hypothetical protein